MRAMMAMVMVSSSALADPPGGSSPRSGPPVAALVLERPAPSEAPQRPAYAPHDQGGFSGIVIDPGPCPDAGPYPRGMVIAPLDPGDRMPNAIARPWTWASRGLWQRLSDAAAAVWRSLHAPAL
jgi:hypothetical protein